MRFALWIGRRPSSAIVGKKGKVKAGKGASSNAGVPALCAITTVTARDAGEALMIVARKLGNTGILTQNGSRILEKEGRRIKNEKDRQDWSIFIDPSERVEFEWTTDKNHNDVQPWICADVSVDQYLSGRPPFRSLDVAVQFDDRDRKPVARWHLDLANQRGGSFQSGPLTHLQFGGHQKGFRELDHPLKAPRWCHPPMEPALVCEVVAANFYEDEWLALREDESWCRAIARFQQLCYPNYLNKMAEAFLKPRTTLLNEVWASDWVRNAEAAAG